MNLSVFFSCLALLQILKMPVKRTLPSMTRMTMLKSRSSKCFAGHGSAVVTSVKSFWGWKLWTFALVLHTDKGEVLISVVVYFFAECTRTNWPLWRDSCSNYKKVITVFFPRMTELCQEFSKCECLCLFHLVGGDLCEAGLTRHNQILTGYSWWWLGFTSSGSEGSCRGSLKVLPLSLAKKRDELKQIITADKQSSAINGSFCIIELVCYLLIQ